MQSREVTAKLGEVMQLAGSTTKLARGFEQPRTFSGEHPVAGGVALRISHQLGASPLVVRVGFTLLSLAAGWGVVLYGVIWALTYGHPPAKKSQPTVRHNLGVIAATASQMLVIFQLINGLPSILLWPACAVSFALAISEPVEPTSEPRFWHTDLWRVGLGIALMVGGLLATIGATGDFTTLWRAATAALVLVGGIGLVATPWLRGVLAASDDERRSRIRAEERSDMASHLHDSVLQTLTLIQNRASEPDVAAALAHQQERELRKWLYGQGEELQGSEPKFRDALESAAAAVEGQYLKIIECIVVGDKPMDSNLAAVVAASREAMVNAAKFAEIPIISVYAEVGADSVLVFVRDRGVGFEPATVPEDRHGISDSIQSRVERVGGTATVRSSLGAGTEVRIEWQQ